MSERAGYTPSSLVFGFSRQRQRQHRLLCSIHIRRLNRWYLVGYLDALLSPSYDELWLRRGVSVMVP
jgi:hypothetical protein